jgi:hypothetical protein
MTAERRLALLIAAQEDANADAPRGIPRPTPGLHTCGPEEDAYYIAWYHRCYQIAKGAQALRRRTRRSRQRERIA